MKKKWRHNTAVGLSLRVLFLYKSPQSVSPPVPCRPCLAWLGWDPAAKHISCHQGFPSLKPRKSFQNRIRLKPSAIYRDEMCFLSFSISYPPSMVSTRAYSGFSWERGASYGWGMAWNKGESEGCARVVGLRLEPLCHRIQVSPHSYIITHCLPLNQ